VPTFVRLDSFGYCLRWLPRSRYAVFVLLRCYCVTFGYVARFPVVVTFAGYVTFTRLLHVTFTLPFVFFFLRCDLIVTVWFTFDFRCYTVVRLLRSYTRSFRRCCVCVYVCCPCVCYGWFVYVTRCRCLRLVCWFRLFTHAFGYGFVSFTHLTRYTTTLLLFPFGCVTYVYAFTFYVVLRYPFGLRYGFTFGVCFPFVTFLLRCYVAGYVLFAPITRCSVYVYVCARLLRLVPLPVVTVTAFVVVRSGCLPFRTLRLDLPVAFTLLLTFGFCYTFVTGYVIYVTGWFVWLPVGLRLVATRLHVHGFRVYLRLLGYVYPVDVTHTRCCRTFVALRSGLRCVAPVTICWLPDFTVYFRFTHTRGYAFGSFTFGYALPVTFTRLRSRLRTFGCCRCYVTHLRLSLLRYVVRCVTGLRCVRWLLLRLRTRLVTLYDLRYGWFVTFVGWFVVTVRLRFDVRVPGLVGCYVCWSTFVAFGCLLIYVTGLLIITVGFVGLICFRVCHVAFSRYYVTHVAVCGLRCCLHRLRSFVDVDSFRVTPRLRSLYPFALFAWFTFTLPYERCCSFYVCCPALRYVFALHTFRLVTLPFVTLRARSFTFGCLICVCRCLPTFDLV